MYQFSASFQYSHHRRNVSFRPATLFKKRLWHKCFPVNFSEIFKNTFFIEHLRWLLLSLHLHPLSHWSRYKQCIDPLIKCSVPLVFVSTIVPRILPSLLLTHFMPPSRSIPPENRKPQGFCFQGV